MANPSRIARLSRGLIGRLIIGVVAIHLTLIPLLFAGVLYIVKEGYQGQFVDQLRSDSYLLSILVGSYAVPPVDEARLQKLVDEALLSGDLVFMNVVDASGRVLAAAEARDTHISFKEDFFFGEHGDAVYYVSLPVYDNNGKKMAMLRLGYDEVPTREQIDLTHQRGLYLAIGYVALTLFLLVLGWRVLNMMRKELVMQADALEHQALHDTLTHLPNRALLQDRLLQVIRNSQRERSTFSLFLMDLDRFKEVNDTLGHHAGDLILQEVALRLREVIRESDTVARLGGDEFAVVLPRVDAAGAVLTAEKILKALHEPFSVEGRVLPLGGSIGIALFPEHGEDGGNLLRRADVAMYAAKHAGGGIMLYAPELDTHSVDRLTLATELRQGIERDEIEVYYQPKLNLKTGEICGVEALARWRHPQRGLILPVEFISLAERTGVINILTLRVLDAAIKQCSAWTDANLHIPVAVNLSPISFIDAQLAERIQEILEKYECSAYSLVLEVTEGALMADTRRAHETLARLDAMGVALSIDDFGTGYSSLVRLKNLPLSEVKIDQSFVIDMLEDDNDAAIVRATIDLAHNLGLKVVAEGVETAGHLEKLNSFGCDMAQGYYLSRPLPAAEIQRLIMSNGKLALAVA
jgi:diguanylate cyclase (GGDEF)-like protein